MSVYRAIKDQAIALTKNRAIGVPLALTAKAIGRIGLSRKISVMCDFAPKWVPVAIPGKEDQPIFMAGENGREPVSRAFWFGGWRGFEFPMPDMFARLAAQAHIVLDIGSFSGLYSLISARVNGEAKVYAFEPFPVAQRLIKNNIDRNDFHERIALIEIALSDAPGSARLSVPTTETGLLESSSSIAPIYEDKTLESFEVKKDTLDNVCAEKGISGVSLIKLDVEQHEETVLKGGRKTFERDRPILFMEILKDMETGFFNEFFNSLNYHNYSLGGERLLKEDVIAYSANGDNHVLCPSERAAEIESAAAAIGLPVMSK